MHVYRLNKSPLHGMFTVRGILRVKAGLEGLMLAIARLIWAFAKIKAESLALDEGPVCIRSADIIEAARVVAEALGIFQ